MKFDPTKIVMMIETLIKVLETETDQYRAIMFLSPAEKVELEKNYVVGEVSIDGDEKSIFIFKLKKNA